MDGSANAHGLGNILFIQECSVDNSYFLCCKLCMHCSFEKVFLFPWTTMVLHSVHRINFDVHLLPTWGLPPLFFSSLFRLIQHSENKNCMVDNMANTMHFRFFIVVSSYTITNVSNQICWCLIIVYGNVHLVAFKSRFWVYVLNLLMYSYSYLISILTEYSTFFCHQG